MASWMGAGPIALDSQEEEIARLNKVIREQNVQYDTAKEQYERTSKELLTERRSLKETLAKLQAEADLRTKSEATLERYIADSKNFNSLKINYENTIEMQTSKIHEMEKQVKQSEKELAAHMESRSFDENRLQQESQVSSKRIAQLSADLNQANHELDLYRDIKSKSAKSTAARRRSSSLSNVSPQQEALNQQSTSILSTQAQDLDKLRARLSHTERELCQAQNMAQACQKRSEGKVEEAQKRCEALEEQIGELQWEHGKLENQIESQAQEIGSLRQELAKSKSAEDQHSQTLQLQIVRLEQEVQDLSQSIQIAESQLGTTSHLQNQLAATKDRCVELEIMEQTLQDSLLQLQQRLDNTKQSTQAATSATSSQLADLQRKYDALEIAYSDLEIESESKKIALSKCETLLSEQKHQLLQIEEEHTRLQMMLKISQEAADAFKGERDQLLGALAVLEKDKVAIEGMEEILNEARQDVVNAEQRCTVVEEDFELVAAERDDLQNQIEQLKQEGQLLEAQQVASVFTSDVGIQTPSTEREAMDQNAITLLVARLRSERDALRLQVAFMHTEQLLNSKAAEEQIAKLEEVDQERVLLRQELEEARTSLVQTTESLATLQAKDASPSRTECIQASAILSQNLQPDPESSLFLSSSFSDDSDVTQCNLDDSVFFGDVATPEIKRVKSMSIARRRQHAKAPPSEKTQLDEQIVSSDATVLDRAHHLQAALVELREALADEILSHECTQQLLDDKLDTLASSQCQLTAAQDEVSVRTEEHNATLARIQADYALQIETLKAKVAEGVRMVGELQNGITLAESQVETEKRKTDDLQTLYAKAQTDLHQTLEQMRTLTTEQARLAEEKRKQAHLVGTAQQELRLAEEKLGEFRTLTQGKEKEALVESHALNAEITVLQRKIDEQSAKFASDIEAAWQDQKQGRDSLLARAEAAEDEVRNKAGQFEDLCKDNARLSKEISTLRGLISQKEETAARLEETLNLTRNEAENLIQDFNLCSAELEKREKEDEEREDRLLDREETVHRLEAELQTLATTNKKVTEDLEQLRKTSAELRETLSNFEERIQSKEEEIEETEDRYLNSLKDIKKLQSANERLQVRCESLQSAVATLEVMRSKQLEQTLASQTAVLSPITMARRLQSQQNAANTTAHTPIVDQENQPIVTAPSSNKKRQRPVDLTHLDTSLPPRAITIVPVIKHSTAATPRSGGGLRTLSLKKSTAPAVRSPLSVADRNRRPGVKGTKPAQLMASIAALRAGS